MRTPPLLGAAAAALLVVLVTRAEPASPGEPLAWRWLRVAAQHPVRTALAFWLLTGAARAGPTHRSIPALSSRSTSGSGLEVESPRPPD